MPRHDDTAVERAGADALARWRTGATLTTLDLRSACHAAQREGADADARVLAGEIDTREARGETS